MRCAICGFQIDSVDEAVEEGSTPYFCDGETEHEFACLGCAETFLQEGEDGEMEVKDGYRGKQKSQKTSKKEPKTGFDCQGDHPGKEVTAELKRRLTDVPPAPTLPVAILIPLDFSAHAGTFAFRNKCQSVASKEISDSHP